MNLFPEMLISGSGLAVERTRLEVIARNIANVNTTKTAGGEAFRRQLVQVMEARETEDGDGLAAGALVTGVTQDMSPFRMVYEPAHPDANHDGYVAKPNVDVMMEMVDLMGATRSYEANVTVLQSAKEMIRAALEL